MLAGVHSRKLADVLYQNCVTYPLKPRVNTVIYGHTSTHLHFRCDLFIHVHLLRPALIAMMSR